MTNNKKEYLCIREKQINKHDSEIASLKTRADYKDDKIEELNISMKDMDKKLDDISDTLNDLKLQSAKDDFNIDNRVKALESKLETLKWVMGSAIAILSVLVAAIGLILSYLH